jgi:enterochelin esterase-like enzyme
MSTTTTGPAVEQGGVRFRLPDPDGKYTAAQLYQEVSGDLRLLDMERRDGGFELWLDRPAVDRMEYLFELTGSGGHTSRALDPDNPASVDGAFGRKSVVEFPGYAQPRWLPGSDEPAELTELAVPSDQLGAPMPVRLWHPAGFEASQPLPLLVVQDGFEFEKFASITAWADAAVTRGWVRPFRMALLHPVERTGWYAADPAYADALVEKVLPAVSEATALVEVPVITGASLGGLAALHTHIRHPGVFGGLFLQSGSFFTAVPEGREESLYAIPPFVNGLHSSATLADPLPTVMTAGQVERNLANIRRMARTLAARGYDVELHEVPDGHNYTAWRDALDPYLTGLLARLWDTDHRRNGRVAG